MLSCPPFGLRSPTGHCRWDEGGADGTGPRLEVDIAMELSRFVDEVHRRTATGRHLLGATGRDRLQVTDLRQTPAPGFVAATARLTGFHQWLGVTAHQTEVQALGRGAAKVSSLWLAAVVALREQTMAGDRPQWLWLLGLDDSQRVRLNPDGRVYVEEVSTGLNRLIDLVQREMGLHFRTSAFDLLFNEDFDWEDAPAGIVQEFTAPLRAATEHHARGQTLAVLGLGPRLAALGGTIARSVGMEPWRPPGPESLSPRPVACEVWLLREAAEREVDGLPLTAAFAGAPLFLPPPGEALGTGADRGAPSVPPSAAEPGAADSAERADAAGTRRQGRKTRRGGWLRHHPRQAPRRRTDDRSTRKVVFVVLWVLAALLAGHVLVEQGTEHGREQQEFGRP